MSDTNILLTIAIPTYNGSLYIRDTLNSIVTQLEDSVEIIISDNASTDDVASIVREFQEKYPSIKYFCNRENIGADRNFDLAVVRSSGRYVWLFSDDDILEEGAVNHVLGIIKKYKSLGHICVNYGVFDVSLEVCHEERGMKCSADSFCGDGETYLRLIRFAPIFMCANIFRRELWMAAQKDTYVGTGWIHYGVLVSSIRQSEAYCVAYPYIKLRTRAVWAGNGGLWLHTLSLSRIVHNLGVYGYSAQTIDCLRRQLTLELGKTFLAARRDGLHLNIKLIKESVREFYKYSRFWLQVVPLSIVPVSVIRKLFSMKRRMRRKHEA